MRNSNLISLADYYRKVLNGARIEDTGLDPKSIKKLKLFILYADRDMLQTQIMKQTDLSRSSIYKLKKVRSEHAISKWWYAVNLLPRFPLPRNELCHTWLYTFWSFERFSFIGALILSNFKRLFLWGELIYHRYVLHYT